MSVVMPLLGLFVMMGISVAFSTNRRLALKNWRLIAWGLGLQFVFAVFILKFDIGRALFSKFNDAFVALTDCTREGAAFVFGDKLTDPAQGLGFFAFYVLSTIVFFSSLAAILYHLGIMQKVVRALAWVMAVTMKTSGAETMSTSANIFLGQTEAPLLVRPFIPTMTRSELMAIMTGGFATVAGSVMAAYVSFLRDSVPNVAGHLLASSLMAAPATLVFAKLMVPEDGVAATAGKVDVHLPKTSEGLLDAATEGASEGVRLAINVGGMLIAFLALVAFVDLLLGFVGGAVVWPFTGGAFEPLEQLTLERIAEWVFYPFALLLGIPAEEAGKAASLLGIKTVTNEFVAYIKLGQMTGEFSERTRVILTYALCGFANFGSIGIQIGGLAVMAPNKRAELARLGLPAMVAGTFATYSTACVAAMLY